MSDIPDVMRGRSWPLRHVSIVVVLSSFLMLSLAPLVLRCSRVSDAYLPQYLYLQNTVDSSAIPQRSGTVKGNAAGRSLAFTGRSKEWPLFTSSVEDLPSHNASVILLVTLSVWPVVKTGGIATMFTTYAKLWASQNYTVHLFVPKSCDQGAAESYWRPYGVSFSCLGLSNQDDYAAGTEDMKVAYHAFLNVKDLASMLKVHTIVFHDWHGIAFYIVHAKRAGIYFNDTLLITTCHTSTKEAKKWKGDPIDTKTAVTVSMEDYIRTFADVSVYPSVFFRSVMLNQSMYNDISAPGWQLHIPNFVPESILRKKDRANSLNRSWIGGFAFFGRADKLKGIHVFIEAVRKLVSNDDSARKLQPPRQLAFFSNVPSKGIKHDIERFCKDMEAHGIRVLTFQKFNTDKAIDFMIDKKLVPVTPSLYENFPMALLETVSAGLPTIHGSYGGQHEVSATNLNEVQSGSVQSLHDRLAFVLGNGAEFDSPRVDHGTVVRDYSKLPSLRSKPMPNLPLESLPCADVTVCMVFSGNDVGDAIDAFRGQSCVPGEYVFIHICGAGRKCPTATPLKGSSVRSYHMTDSVSVGEARNFAMSKVNTPYLVLFDENDMPLPSFIETMIRAAELQNASLVTSFYANVLKKPSAKDVVNQNVQIERVSLAAGNTGPAVNLVGDYSGGGNVLMRFDVYQRHGGYLPELLHGMSIAHVDWSLYTTVILNRGIIAVVPLPLYYCTTSPSYSSRHGSTISEAGFGHQKIIQYYCDHFNDRALCQIFQLMAGNSLK